MTMFKNVSCTLSLCCFAQKELVEIRLYILSIYKIPFDFLRFCFVSGDGGRRCFLMGALGLLLIGIGGVTKVGIKLGLSGDTAGGMMEDDVRW